MQLSFTHHSRIPPREISTAEAAALMMAQTHIMVVLNARHNQELPGLLVDFLPGEIALCAIFIAGASATGLPMVMQRPQGVDDDSPGYILVFFCDTPKNRAGFLVALIAAGAYSTLVEIAKGPPNVTAPILLLSGDPEGEAEIFSSILAALEQFSQGRGITLSAN